MAIYTHLIMKISHYVCINIIIPIMAKDFSKTFQVKTPVKEVFLKIKDVRVWWSGLFAEEFKGASEKINDEFEFRAGEGLHYSKQRLVELIPNRKIVWLVTESNLSFLQNPKEWEETRLVFDLEEKNGNTVVTFTHVGLNPEVECYENCAPAWSQYLTDKLLPLIS